MIQLGLNTEEKDKAVTDYCLVNQIKKVFVLTPKAFEFTPSVESVETVEWNDIIKYIYFYRLLQEIDASTLVVVNECLRVQNRYDLTYNCIRHFLNQSGHKIIFQYLPIIESIEDFMILFDFDTKSQWKRENFNVDLMQNSEIVVAPVNVSFSVTDIAVSEKTEALYAAEKKKLFDGIGLKDPHTIPRNLYLLGGRDKILKVEGTRNYIARNNRFKAPNFQTYKEANYNKSNYCVFEFPHNYIDFVDFLSHSKQCVLDVLKTDLKVEGWYLDRYQTWLKNLKDAYASLQ